MKTSVSKEKFACPYSNCLRGHAIFGTLKAKTEKVRETVFACSYGAQVVKKARKSRDTVPLEATRGFQNLPSMSA